MNSMKKCLRKKGSEKTFYQIRRVYPRANKQKLCPTLTAIVSTGGHNVPLLPLMMGKNKNGEN